MKHFFTLLSIFVFTVSLLNAQTTITYEANGLKVGDANTSYSSEVHDFIDIHAPGGNKTWDLSAYTSTSEGFIVQFIDPATTPWGAQVPNSNLAIWQKGDDGETAVYYSVTPSQMSYLAVATKANDTIETMVILDDDRVMMRFPFAYNDEFEDDASMQFEYSDGSGVTYRFEGDQNDKVVADAWGDLVTPYGTFNDVLRVREESTEILDLYANDVLVMTTYDTTLSYVFYHSSNKLPIAIVDYDADFPSEVTVSFNQSSTGISEHETAVKVAYPNPASDYMTLDLRPFKEESVVQLLDVSGKAVASFTAGNEEERVDLSNYPEGVYLVAGEDKGHRVLTQKVTIVK